MAAILSAENYVDYCTVSENLHRVLLCFPLHNTNPHLVESNQNISVWELNRDGERQIVIPASSVCVFFNLKQERIEHYSLFTNNILQKLKRVFWKLEKVISLLGITRGSHVLMSSMYT